jgi:hypothetical protein
LHKRKERKGKRKEGAYSGQTPAKHFVHGNLLRAKGDKNSYSSMLRKRRLRLSVWFSFKLNNVPL